MTENVLRCLHILVTGMVSADIAMVCHDFGRETGKTGDFHECIR